MDEPAAYLAPAVGIVAADDDDVGRHPKVAQRAMEAHRLIGLVGDFGLDDEAIDITSKGATSRIPALASRCLPGGSP